MKRFVVATSVVWVAVHPESEWTAYKRDNAEGTKTFKLAPAKS